jgi:hypothetical protein
MQLGALSAHQRHQRWIRDLYVAASVPIGVVDVKRSVWLTPLAAAWLVVASVSDQAWATALLLVLPVVLLSAWRRSTRL